MPEAEIGVFGGSGFYEFLEDAEEVDVETPFGPPSAPPVIGEIEGKRVAFLPRHGRRHELPPAQINYRANVWAMKELGVQRIVGPCASGALRADFALGEFVVCDQFVDRTSGREDTFYEGPDTTHVSAADPFCPDLRRILVETGRELGFPVRDGGTVVVIQGPRFSTRAESHWFQEMGWDVVNMSINNCPNSATLGGVQATKGSHDVRHYRQEARARSARLGRKGARPEGRSLHRARRAGTQRRGVCARARL